MIFHDATITLTGNRYSTRTHDSSDLAPPAIGFFLSLLEQRGDVFRCPMPVAGLEWLELSSEGEGAAMATFWRRDEPITTSALVSGLVPLNDHAVLRGLQSLILRLMLPHGIEPGFDLMDIDLRPLIVSVPIGGNRDDLMLVADAETCLAAAWFAHVGVA